VTEPAPEKQHLLKRDGIEHVQRPGLHASLT
jgi:hypothetical protein